MFELATRAWFVWSPLYDSTKSFDRFRYQREVEYRLNQNVYVEQNPTLSKLRMSKTSLDSLSRVTLRGLQVTNDLFPKKA